MALWNKGTHICGASILTKDMILTAAHCVYNIVNPTDMEAFFGVSSKDEILNKARFMIVKVKVYWKYCLETSFSSKKLSSWKLNQFENFVIRNITTNLETFLRTGKVSKFIVKFPS